MATDQNQTWVTLAFRVPAPVYAAVKCAAEKELTTVSAYARKAQLDRLRIDGIDPAQFVPAA